MKKKYLSISAVIVIITVLAIIQYNNIKEYYEQLHNLPGIRTENLENKLVEENNQAIKDGEEYQKLLKKQKAGDIFSQGNEKHSSQGNENRSSQGIEEHSSQGNENRSSQGNEEHNSDGNEESNNTQAGEENSTDSPEDVFIPDLSLHALSALLLDADNNRVLYEKNGFDELPMASTTKIMTCIVALENSKPDDIVEVSSYAAKMPDVQLNIRAGEQYYMKDLLYSLMLESHNDTAVAIAEHIGGSVEGFATMMNDKARSLGCSHTNFITPNGLDANGHHTTARELAVIASYAIKNEQFIEITNTTTYSFKEINKGRQFSVANKNRFLYMMEGAIGVKTGFTGGAGYCFVGAIKRPDRTLVSVVLGCGWPPRKSLKWSDTKELMSYGIDNYQEKQIIMKEELPPITVKKGQSAYETLKCDKTMKLLMREDEKVSIEYELPSFLQAPITAESEVGKAKFYINHVLFKEIPIYTVEDIKRIDFNFCLNEILRLWNGCFTKCE